jgi:hypothetical protein
MSVDQKQLNRLVRLINKIEKTGQNSIFETIKQTSIFFAESASKETAPGKKQKPREMAQKHKFRKVVTISARKQKQSGLNHYFNLSTKKHFVSKAYYTPSRAQKMGLVRATKFLDAINRKTGKRMLLAHNPTKGKPSKRDRRIPFAGAGKWGWLSSKMKLNGKSGKTGNISSKVGVVKVRKSGKNPFIKMINNVKYVSKTSPNSARIGLRKATNRLRRVYFPKLDKKIQAGIK